MSVILAILSICESDDSDVDNFNYNIPLRITGPKQYDEFPDRSTVDKILHNEALFHSGRIAPGGLAVTLTTLLTSLPRRFTKSVNRLG